jgi:16S rRNA (cytidine1402-2'-O)-methyltransferase
VCGPDRLLTVARELTKRFEEIATFPMGEGAAWLAADTHREQGEFVLIAHAPAEQEADEEADPRTDALLDALLESLSLRDAARVAAKVSGLPRDVLYNRALARKKSAE